MGKFLLVVLALFVFMGLFASKPPVTIEQITQAVGKARDALKTTQILSKDTVSSVNNAYQNLSTFLDSAGLSNEQIKNMETALASMKDKDVKLQSSLDKTQSEADSLFLLLERRTDENKTDNFKNAMLAGIKEKKSHFGQKLEIAKTSLSKVALSIQKYDDILGFVQVNGGLKGVEKYINDINQSMRQADQLNNEIQKSINEAIIIVNALQ